MFNTVFQAPFRALFNASAGVIYLLRDEFTTPESAPLASPRTCEPGPGQLTIVDTGNKLSIAGGYLDCGLGTGVSDPRVYGNNISKTGGVCYKTTINIRTNGISYAGISSASTSYGFQPSANGIIPRDNHKFVYSLTNNTNYTFYQIIRPSNGYLYFAKGGSQFGSEVVFVLSSLFTTGASLVPVVLRNVAVGTVNMSVDYARLTKLSGALSEDFGIATSHIASPSSGQSVQGSANGQDEITWTAGAGETLELMTRYTDDNNCWIVRCSQAGSTIKLIEKNAGVETERSSAAHVFTPGAIYRILVRKINQEIVTHVGVATSLFTAISVNSNQYLSAAFNQAETGVKVQGFSGAINFACWPRSLSASIISQLETI